MNEKLNILICPLEWGLGHAARIIPIARSLREMNHMVIIASGEEHLSLIRNELPGITCIDFSGFKPSYSAFLPQYLSMLLKTPVLIFHIIKEHYRLKKIIKENNIDIVISDNRFGLWNRGITSVYITHMPRIPFPEPFRFLEFIGVLLHRSVINKYTYCFIPDLPGRINLTGRLSHNLKLPGNVRYIGILSRFSIPSSAVLKEKFSFPHNTVILSGPEPQKTILKRKLIDILKEREPATIVLEGKPGKDTSTENIGNIRFYNHLPAPEIISLITNSQCVISRSGYTTIMELVSLKSNALLIPTPGQTEQEYLGKYLSEMGWFETISQNHLNKGSQFPAKNAEWTNSFAVESESLFKNALNELLEKHNKEG